MKTALCRAFTHAPTEGVLKIHNKQKKNELKQMS